MAATTIASLNFDDELFIKHMTALIPDKVAFLTSGILTNVSNDPQIASQSGQFLNMPRYAKFSGNTEQLTAATDLTVDPMSDVLDRSVWLERGKAWGSEDWIRWVAATEPLDEMAKQMSSYIAREIQYFFNSGVLPGTFATALASTHSTGTDYSGATIDLDAVIGAKKLLGDVSDELGVGVVNSKVFYDALKLKIATYEPLGTSEAFSSGRIGNLLGMSVAMDDNLTATSSVYPSYFGVPGSAVYAFRVNPRLEKWRNPLKAGGTDYLILTFSVAVHIPGCKYNSSTVNPSVAQLATGSNWTKVEATKNIKIVELKTL